jgi:tetratricopeptide (TPR) repeat protein
MGRVYLAEDPRLGRKVALKLLEPELADDERFRARFTKESRIAASLDHPNIVPIYEAGEQEGVLFIAMRYVEGTDLGRLIRDDGALPLDRAVTIVSQVGSALDAAHRRGLVHRDVKPSNILVGEDDHAYLTDFGLIKGREADTSLTKSGQFMGSVDYAAPEQIMGQEIDGRADVYSLGCVLYECLSGEPPYPRHSEAAALYAHLKEPPPSVTPKRPELPPTIDAVVAKAMAKKPEDRYQAAGRLGEAAREALALSAAVSSTAPPTERQLAERIFGRSLELAQLSSFVEAVPSGPIALLLEGAPGIGKTVLWKEVVALASQASCRVLEARPIESETQLPFVALGDLLEDSLDEALPVLPELQRRALEVALLRSEAGESQPDWRAVSLGALGVLRHIAGSRPLLVAIDDIQWLDASSGRVLEFAIRRLRKEPVGLVATIRPNGEVHVPLGLDRALPEDRVRRLPVGPVSIDVLGHLLRSRLGSDFLHPTLVKLHYASGGNPFFALEIARALLRRGMPLAPGQALPVPDNLRQLIRERFAALQARTRDALSIAAALSQPTVSLVGAALGGREAAPLQEAVDADIIEIEGEAITFAHPLFRSVIYSHGSTEDRRELHRRLADLVPDIEERARHLALGAYGPSVEVSAELDEAARRAWVRGAPDAAADLAELAILLTPADRAEDRSRRGLGAAEYLFEAGDTRRARSLLEETVRVLPTGLARGKALRLLGAIRWYDNPTDAARMLEEALEEAQGDPALGGGIERDLAWVAMYAGDLRDATQHAISSLELADRQDDAALRAEALTAVGFTAGCMGLRSAFETLERAIRLAERTEGARFFRHPNLMYAILEKWTDQFDAARSRFEVVSRQAAEQGDESTLPYLLYHISELEAWAGNWPLADQYANESYEAAIQTSQDPTRASCLYVKALVNARMGRVESARSAAEEGQALAERNGDVVRFMSNRAVLGFLDLSLGRPREAYEYLRRVDELCANMNLTEPGAIRFPGDEIECLISLGEMERARSLIQQLEERGKELDRSWALAVAGRCRGLLEAALGRPNEAMAAIERALDEHQRLPDPFERARTLLVLGNVQLQAKDRDGSRRPLEEALAIFDSLGAVIYSGKASAELARVG